VCISHEAIRQNFVMSTMSFSLSNSAGGEDSVSKSAVATFVQMEVILMLQLRRVIDDSVDLEAL
jgi:hypothetical protein